ncbi:MAG: FadR/GntR family transcriptional regulator [Candidatus Hydrogenedentota bacterium]
MTRPTKPGTPATATASHMLATQLVRAILAGKHAAGEKLPTERAMAERFGVSRHVVREALKRLEALELVRIQQGSGVYVKDVVLTGGLELFEYLLFDPNGWFDADALRDFFTFWLLFVPDVFRLAAAAHTEADVAEMHAALEQRAQALDDIEAFTAANERLMRAIANATHNRVYQLLFNNVGRVLLKLRVTVPLDQFAPMLTQENLARLIEAVERRDAELAAFLGRRETQRGLEQAEAFLEKYGQRRNP